MKKTFVLDTNVLLFDPTSILKFGKDQVFIPLICVEELDKFKRDQTENGRNARQFSRIVDKLRTKGSLADGVDLVDGGKLIIRSYSISEKFKNNHSIDLSKNDNLILGSALALQDAGNDVALVTKDINLRLKADVVGLHSEDYGQKDLTFEGLYLGHRQFDVEIKRLEEFKKAHFLPLEGEENKNFFANEYVILCEKNNPSNRSLGRISMKKNGVVPLIPLREGVFGIYPKNIEQQFAFDALLNKDVKLVSLVGKAGTGKTLVAVAAGMELVLERNEFNRILISRPIQPLGRDLGYLPGDVQEKMNPWMKPIFDTVDFIFNKGAPANNNDKKNHHSVWPDLEERGILQIEPLTYIRGRSIHSQFLIIDESQNLSPHEMKTVITRAGEGTKIVLTGDCEQIDNPYLDSVNNGLAYVVERLKSEEIVSHITLKAGERSALSEVASKLL